MENTSGSGKAAQVPAEIKRWNWGAFLLNWIWGIGNDTFVAFLMFVPVVNFVMPFVLGAKGSAWAWRNKRWDSIEAFKHTQRRWAFWGAVVAVASIVLFTGLFAALMLAFEHSAAYRMTVRVLDTSPQAAQILGRPISAGLPTGQIHISGPDGEARLSFSAEGPRGKGNVYVKATKSLGQWKIDRVVLVDGKTQRRVDLAAESAPAGKDVGQHTVITPAQAGTQ